MHAIVMVHKMQRLALSSSSMDVDSRSSCHSSCPPISEDQEERQVGQEAKQNETTKAGKMMVQLNKQNE